jgi:hypothetical protein
MKIGQIVNFYRPAENIRKDAEVVAIDEGGKAKLLALRFTEDGQVVEATAVSHYKDAPEGAPFWLLKGIEKAPHGWAEAILAPDTEVLTDEHVVPETEDTPKRGRRK